MKINNKIPLKKTTFKKVKLNQLFLRCRKVIVWDHLIWFVCLKLNNFENVENVVELYPVGENIDKEHGDIVGQFEYCTTVYKLDDEVYIFKNKTKEN